MDTAVHDYRPFNGSSRLRIHVTSMIASRVFSLKSSVPTIEARKTSRRDAGEETGNHYLVKQRGAAGAQQTPATGGGDSRSGKSDHTATPSQTPDKIEILHDRKRCESAELLECPLSHEQALVAVRPVKDTRSDVRSPFDKPHACSGSICSESKGAGDD